MALIFMSFNTTVAIQTKPYSVQGLIEISVGCRQSVQAKDQSGKMQGI